MTICEIIGEVRTLLKG